MTNNVELETTVIKKYVERTKRERYIQFVSQPQNRHKFIRELYHFKHFFWEIFDEVNKNEVQVVISKLQENNILVKSCYVISTDSRFDMKILEIDLALRETLGNGMGTILVFGHADLIFYEGEPPKSRFIAVRL
jgi:hypothetical protein